MSFNCPCRLVLVLVPGSRFLVVHFSGCSSCAYAHGRGVRYIARGYWNIRWRTEFFSFFVFWFGWSLRSWSWSCSRRRTQTQTQTQSAVHLIIIFLISCLDLSGRSTKTGKVSGKRVFDLDSAFWSFGHSPIIIIIIMIVSYSGPGDNNKSMLMLVLVLVIMLWLFLFLRFPCSTCPVGVSDSGFKH